MIIGRTFDQREQYQLRFVRRRLLAGCPPACLLYFVGRGRPFIGRAMWSEFGLCQTPRISVRHQPSKRLQTSSRVDRIITTNKIRFVSSDGVWGRRLNYWTEGEGGIIVYGLPVDAAPACWAVTPHLQLLLEVLLACGEVRVVWQCFQAVAHATHPLVVELHRNFS